MIAFGIDIGTTTLRASAVEITVGPFGKKEYCPLGEPLCQFTPYEGATLKEMEILEALKEWSREMPTPDIGTLLFTGEAQRAPNAASLGEKLTEEWRGLFSAQLDPELETRVAAFGSGAVALSAQRLGNPVLHFDVGGGTTNMAWIENGEIKDTACLDLGARKWIFDPQTHRVVRKTRQAAAIELLLNLPAVEEVDEATAESLASAIAGWILDLGGVPNELVVVPWKGPRKIADAAVLSFSGGVVDCLAPGAGGNFSYGDIGPWLAKALVAQGRALKKEIHLSKEQGRATAFGVSAYGFQVSGNSIFSQLTERLVNVPLYEAEAALATTLPATAAIRVAHATPDLTSLTALAETWAAKLSQKPSPRVLVFVFEKNLAKTFGFLLQKAAGATGVKFAVLDEISLPAAEPGLPARTLDLVAAPEQGRFLVTVKSLRRF